MKLKVVRDNPWPKANRGVPASPAQPSPDQQRGQGQSVAVAKSGGDCVSVPQEGFLLLEQNNQSWMRVRD